MTKDPITKDQAVKNLDLLRIVVSELVELNNFDYGSCPFHSEATSSFNIFKAKSGKARYHCFGCEDDGDVFTFLQRAKQLSFKAALDYLSQLIDRPISSQLPFSGQSGETAPQFQGLLDSKDDPPTKFCEKDCPKYAALREDYNAILEQSYTEAGVQINPGTTTIPGLVNEIQLLRARIKILETKPRKPPNNLGGFGSSQCG